MFLVHYVDDFKVKHLCVANDIYELNFLRERFGEIDYEVIEKWGFSNDADGGNDESDKNKYTPADLLTGVKFGAYIKTLVSHNSVTLCAIKNFDFIDFDDRVHYALKKGTHLVVNKVENWGDKYYYGVTDILEIPGVNGKPFLFGYVELNEDYFEIEE